MKTNRLRLLGEVNSHGLGLWGEKKTKTPLLKRERKRKLKEFRSNVRDRAAEAYFAQHFARL